MSTPRTTRAIANAAKKAATKAVVEPELTESGDFEEDEAGEERQRPTYTFNAKVIEANELAKVMKAQQLADDQADRIQLVTNQFFESIDSKTGEAVKTNAFSLRNRELVQQLAPLCPIVSLAKIKALGQPVNPQILAMVLYNADISVTRELREAGIDVNFEGKPYAQTHWHSQITACTPHIDPFFMEEIKELLRTQPSAPVAANNAMPAKGGFVTAVGL